MGKMEFKILIFFMVNVTRECAGMGIDIVAKSSHRFNAVRTRFITAGRDAQTHISLRTVTICEHAAACAQQYD